MGPVEILVYDSVVANVGNGCNSKLSPLVGMLVFCLGAAVEFVRRYEYYGHREWNMLRVTVKGEGEDEGCR
jgi:hypothetical protein